MHIAADHITEGNNNNNNNNDNNNELCTGAITQIECPANEVFKVHLLGAEGVKEQMVKSSYFNTNQVLLNLPQREGE